MQLTNLSTATLSPALPRRSTAQAESGQSAPADAFTSSSANGAGGADLKAFAAQIKAQQPAPEPPAQTQPPAQSQPVAPKTFVYADSGGRINHFAFQLDGHAPPQIRNEVFGAWSTVFKAADPDVKFTITLESQADKAELQKLIGDLEIANPERFNLLVADDLNITMWARDQMIGLGSDQGPILLGQNTMRPHGDDELLPPRIAASIPGHGFDPDKRLVTDGGDEVSNGNETFLGYNSLHLTAEKLYAQTQENSNSAQFSPFSKSLQVSLPDNNPRVAMPDFSYQPNIFKSSRQDLPDEAYWLKEAHNIFEQKYGHSVTIIGADDPATPEVERPATFHIDMGLTPIDNDTVLVGNPKAAVDILKGLSPEQYADHNRRLNEALGLDPAADTLGQMIATNTSAELQHQFDYNAENVEAKGYAVGRLPYLEGPPGLSWVTYNNCLMENYQKDDGTTVRRVFLPTYNLPALDEAATKVYESQGFEVLPLKLPALTSWRGAIRCISNVLDRGEAAPPPRA